MNKKILFALLPIALVAVIIVSSVALSGNTYTWEKTFEVTTPELECKIEISEYRVVGCPVKIWVLLKLDDDCGECWSRCREKWEDGCGDWDEDDGVGKGCCHMNGTYSVSLHWWNSTSDDWQHVRYLQERTHIMLTCRHRETYTFTPTTEGTYKVVVTLETETETFSFSADE